MDNPDLIDDVALQRSPVVANARMNRERGITGRNSYAQDLGFNPLQFLHERLLARPQPRANQTWLDLCCGTGNALIQAAQTLAQEGLASRVRLIGVDLIDMFAPYSRDLDFLHLEAASLSAWSPDAQFDLITCVHGLHYIGDKLDLIQRAVSWLQPDGLFIAHLDFTNLRSDALQTDDIGKALKRAGLQYRPRRRVIVCEGQRALELHYRYLGADDAAGPNYTGQSAVNSYYAYSSDTLSGQ